MVRVIDEINSKFCFLSCFLTLPLTGGGTPYRSVDCYAVLDVPQFKHVGLCTQISLPQEPHCQRVFWFLTNCLIPSSSICIIFSIMLMPYFARYLLSRFFNRVHGKDAHERSQYFPLRFSQKRKLHFLRHLVLGVRQPSHLLLSRTYPMHSRQFIPQGATSESLVCVVTKLLVCLHNEAVHTNYILQVEGPERGISGATLVVRSIYCSIIYIIYFQLVYFDILSVS